MDGVGLWEVRGSNLNGDKKWKKKKKKSVLWRCYLGPHPSGWVRVLLPWGTSFHAILHHLDLCQLLKSTLSCIPEGHWWLMLDPLILILVAPLVSVHVYMCLRNCGTWWSHRQPVFHFWVICIQLIRYLCHKFIIEGWCHIIQDRKPL